MKFLFLDFDGVLPSHFGRDSALRSHLPRLEAVLREFPTVQIVIASDCRKHHTIEELRSFFSPDIAARVIGVTPPDSSSQFEPGRRQRCVEEYLEQQGMTGVPWVALDDEWENFDADANLILCDDGFRDKEERALRAALSGQGNSTARVLAAAASLSGDRDRALAWFHEHRISVLDDKTAEQLVAEGRTEQVLTYIEMLSVGSTG